MTDEKRLVITGGIGSGKSSVSGFLRHHGWAVLDSDAVGHEVLTEDDVVRLVGKFWPHTIHGGVVDRRALGMEVFATPDDLAKLESIVHPLIERRVTTWMQGVSGPAAIEVSVLHLVDRSWGQVVVVDAPTDVRLERVQSRGLRREEAEQRLQAQADRSAWLEVADFVIPNHLDLTELEQATLSLAALMEQ